MITKWIALNIFSCGSQYVVVIDNTSVAIDDMIDFYNAIL